MNVNSIFVALVNLYGLFNPNVPLQNKYVTPDGSLTSLNTLQGTTKLVIAIHGWFQNPNSPHNAPLAKAYASENGTSFVFLDWSDQAAYITYIPAAHNAKQVGIRLGRDLCALENPPSEVHVIGFSLGGRSAFNAAKECPKLNVNTVGLDPAGIGFDEVLNIPRLTIIRTSVFSTYAPLGRVNFFEDKQKGCPITGVNDVQAIGFKSPINIIVAFIFCPHTRALQYYTEMKTNETGKVFMGNMSDGTRCMLKEDNSDCANGSYSFSTNSWQPYAKDIP